MGKDPSEVQPSYFFRSYSLLAGNKENCLGAVVIDDGEDGVITQGRREFRDPIYRDCLKGVCSFFWGDREKRGLLRSEIWFVLLASSTSFYVLLDVVLHPRPPVPPPNREVGGSCPRVAGNRMIMMLPKYLLH